jgi:hypothetical protein
MKLLVYNISTWLLFFTSTLCFSQSNQINHNFCLVVMSSNKTTDKVIFDAAKTKIPGCININKIDDISKTGIIEIYFIEKDEVLPEPWLKDGTISNMWYHEWRGAIPSIRVSVHPQKSLRQILYLTTPVFGIRIYLPGEQTPIRCEMITKGDVSVRELGIEYATNSLKIKTAKVVQDCFRLHPELCDINTN